jgi:hypothetical protein
VPSLTAALGTRQCRPEVGSADGRGLVHLYAAANVVTGRLTARCVKSTQWGRRKAHAKGVSRQRRLQRCFAQHLKDVARAYPPSACGAARRVELVIDNAPWHRGAPIDAVLAQHPHLGLYRLPSYCPQLQPIEWLWRPVRRATTHNTLYPDVHALHAAVRRKVRSLQRCPQAVLQSLGDCWHRPSSPSS